MHLRVGRAHALNAKQWFPLWWNARCHFIGMLPCMFVTMQKSSQKASFLASGEFSKKKQTSPCPLPSFQSVKASRKCLLWEYQQTLSKMKDAPKASEPQNSACCQLLCYYFSNFLLISLVLVQLLVYNPNQSHQQYNKSLLIAKILFLLPCSQKKLLLSWQLNT